MHYASLALECQRSRAQLASICESSALYGNSRAQRTVSLDDRELVGDAPSMALKPCNECKKKISSDANPCPHCGKKNPHGMSKIVLFGGGFLALAVAVWLATGGPRRQINEQAHDAVQDINQQVVRDMIAQYEIAKRNGDRMEVCVHAGIVAAGFLQAHDEAGYQRWKGVEKQDCAAAGVPR